MFRHINSRAAILASYSQPLQDADDNEGNRSKAPRGLECGEQTNGCRRSTHDGERREESILAPNEIADPPKEERPERPHYKSHGESSQISDISESFVSGRIKLQRKDREQASKNVKVIRLDHRRSGDRQNQRQ